MVLTVITHLFAGCQLALKKVFNQWKWNVKIQPIATPLTETRNSLTNKIPIFIIQTPDNHQEVIEMPQTEDDKEEDVSELQIVQYNNQSTNKDIFSLVANALILITLIALFAQVFLYNNLNNVVSIVIGWYIPQAFMSVVIPFFLLKRNPHIGEFISREIMKLDHN